MHSEGDNRHCVPAESGREYSDTKWSRGQKCEWSDEDKQKKTKKTFPLIAEGFQSDASLDILSDFSG